MSGSDRECQENSAMEIASWFGSRLKVLGGLSERTEQVRWRRKEQNEEQDAF